MKVKSLLLSISIFYSILTLGQKNIENLQIYGSYHKSVKKFYASEISKYNKLSKNPVIRFVEDFSLGQGGCTISVDVDSSGNYILTSHCYTLKSFISKNNKYKIFEHSIGITPEFSNRLKELFQFTINQIEKNENDRSGFDGTTYYFVSQDKNINVIGAKIWSPEKKSGFYKIIRICQNDLVKISKGHMKKINRVNKKIDKILNTTQGYKTN